jgi:hypothetical protein
VRNSQTNNKRPAHFSFNEIKEKCGKVLIIEGAETEMPTAEFEHATEKTKTSPNPSDVGVVTTVHL